jgi:thymidine kinase
MNHQFVVYAGCMFSSKTTKLLMNIEKYKYQNKKIVAFKPKIDIRYSDDEISSHIGLKYKAVCVENGGAMLEYLQKLDSFDVVAVDEQFMIKDSSDVLIWLFKNTINVLVSTLDLSYAGKPFHETMKIMPYATHVEKCTSVCTVCGKDAFYTHRKNIDENDEIVVGGFDKYEPRCYQHFPYIQG